MLVPPDRGLSCITSPSCHLVLSCLFCFVEADWRGFLGIFLIQAIVPPCCSCSFTLLMYAQGSFVSKYTLHGLSEKIFLHYYGDFNCLWDGGPPHQLKMVQLGMITWLESKMKTQQKDVLCQVITNPFNFIGRMESSLSWGLFAEHGRSLFCLWWFPNMTDKSMIQMIHILCKRKMTDVSIFVKYC